MEDHLPSTFDPFPDRASERMRRLPVGCALSNSAVRYQNHALRQDRRVELDEGPLNRGLMLQALNNLLLVENAPRASKLNEFVGK